MEILKLVLPCERKSSALEKMEYEEILFSKNGAPRIWGGDALRHFTKMILFLEMLSITVRKRCFSKSHICQKNVKKCPRDAKTALAISGVGEVKKTIFNHFQKMSFFDFRP